MRDRKAQAWKEKMTAKIQAGEKLTKQQAIRYFTGRSFSEAQRHLHETVKYYPGCISKATHAAVLESLHIAEEQCR